MFVGNPDKFYRGIQLPVSVSFKREKQAQAFLEAALEIIPALKYEKVNKTRHYIFYVGDSNSDDVNVLWKILTKNSRKKVFRNE